jgi:hypothetical protein
MRACNPKVWLLWDFPNHKAKEKQKQDMGRDFVSYHLRILKKNVFCAASVTAAL